MKRLSTGVLTVLIAAGLGLSAVAAPASPGSQGNIGNAIAQASPAAAAPAAPAAAPSVPPADFGSPPSGEIPILFNDHHVYSKPDTLRAGRVLSALVRGGTILIPLRSMFEQMGATVSYDPASKTVDVTKPGADVKVTVGKPEVEINGETRPLDVPPMMWHGQILVPVRVISEGMGAYVQWVPDRRLVVVRYLPPTPPPAPATPAPTPVMSAPPTPTPAPVATPQQDRFVSGDFIVSPKVYNAFSPGNSGQYNTNGISTRIRGVAEFDLGHLPWMVEGDYRQFNYPHTCNGGVNAPTADCYVTYIGSTGSAPVAAFTARDYNLDARLGLRIANPKVYIGVGYDWMTGNYGYPKMDNVGFGLEKLPDLGKTFGWYGSFYYYPNDKGTCDVTVCGGGPFVLSYNESKYDLGLDWNLGNPDTTPVFLEVGVLGNYGKNKTNAPSNTVEFGPYVGLGLKF